MRMQLSSRAPCLLGRFVLDACRHGIAITVTLVDPAGTPVNGD